MKGVICIGQLCFWHEVLAMKEFKTSILTTIKDQTTRSLWSLQNVIECIPQENWSKEYCEMPLWKHVYHTLHSLDQWYINPSVYDEPAFHTTYLNSLDIKTDGFLSKKQLINYNRDISVKILSYLASLKEEQLLQKPPKSNYTRLQLILAQHRHLDMHIGMLMGFTIADTGLWPRVMGIANPLPQEDYDKYF